MGYDPMAPGGTPPFRDCDNVLELAEAKRLGVRDPTAIEVAGTPVREARFDFAPYSRSRTRHRQISDDTDERQGSGEE